MARSGQHSFWAGALGFIAAPVIGGMVVKLISSANDTPQAAEVKAAVPHALLAGASYWAMGRYPKQHSLFLGATVGEGLATLAAPAGVMMAKAQANPAPAPGTTVSAANPQAVKALAAAMPPATITERLEATVAKVLNGYAFSK